MNYQIILSPPFLKSLKELGDHIALDNPKRALSWVREVKKRCGILDTLPQGFSKARENGIIDRELKQLVIGKGLNKYRIIFTIFEERREVVILDIRHTARKPFTKGELDV